MCAMKITLMNYMLHIEFTYVNSTGNNILMCAWSKISDTESECLEQCGHICDHNNVQI